MSAERAARMENAPLDDPTVEPCLANREDRIVAGGGRAIQMPQEWAANVKSAPALAAEAERLRLALAGISRGAFTGRAMSTPDALRARMEQIMREADEALSPRAPVAK